MNDNAIKEPKQINMSYNEMTSKFRAVERKGEHLPGYIVFTADSFGLPYDERSRTYGLSSNNKAFQPNMGGYSIYGYCLDGTDPCVRLERYMATEDGGKNGWKIERCYVMSGNAQPRPHCREVLQGLPFRLCQDPEVHSDHSGGETGKVQPCQRCGADGYG